MKSKYIYSFLLLVGSLSMTVLSFSDDTISDPTCDIHIQCMDEGKTVACDSLEVDSADRYTHKQMSEIKKILRKKGYVNVLFDSELPASEGGLKVSVNVTGEISIPKLLWWGDEETATPFTAQKLRADTTMVRAVRSRSTSEVVETVLKTDHATSRTLPYVLMSESMKFGHHNYLSRSFRDLPECMRD